jgi:hypothetical protein
MLHKLNGTDGAGLVGTSSIGHDIQNGLSCAAINVHLAELVVRHMQKHGPHSWRFMDVTHALDEQQQHIMSFNTFLQNQTSTDDFNPPEDISVAGVSQTMLKLSTSLIHAPVTNRYVLLTPP